MAWTAPKTWTVAELVTDAMLNTHLRDNVNYLKGSAGPITIDGALTAPSARVNVPGAVLARFHLIDSSDTFAVVIENVKTVGTPQGLLIDSGMAAPASKLLSVNRGPALGPLTELFSVLGDGTITSQGHSIQHTPLIGAGTTGVVPTPSGVTIPGTQITVTEPGTWMVVGHFYLGAATGGADTGIGFRGFLVMDSTVIDVTRYQWQCPVNASDVYCFMTMATASFTSGTHTFEARAGKSSGGASGLIRGNCYAYWIAP